ncbi:MAG: type II secretion system F family protein [Pseudomonadota bacterium]
MQETGDLPAFVYKGLNADGATVEGRISASDRIDAQRQLEAQTIAPFELRESRATDRVYARRKARPRDRQRFMRQLAVLLRAGTPLLSAFEVMESEEPCRDLAQSASAVRRDLRSGARLSGALRSHLGAGFPEYAPRLVELGETTGDLPKAFNDIASQMEAELKSATEVRNALAYPSFLAVAGLVAVTFIFLFVVPRFAALLGEDRSDLPAFSRWVIETGVFLRAHLMQTGAVAAGLVVAVILGSRNPGLRGAVEQALMSAPVIGRFLKASETARWARICGTALSGGAPLLDALSLAEAAVRSNRRRQGLIEARRAIRSGDALDEALKRFGEFDAMTINLIKTGRISASLDEMLLFVAETHEAEAQSLAKQLTSLAEPIAIAFIAIVVGVIVVSLVMAMTSLYDVAL